MSDEPNTNSPAIDSVSDVAALGPTVETPHHALALDPIGTGFWATIDRIAFLLSDRLNPILIKEARESLKSRQFLITFFLLLTATIIWTVLGIVFNAPEVYYLPTGPNLLAGYYFLMAIPIFGLVPLAAYRSLSSELENDTFELLSITELASHQIVRGKFASAVLQMMLYFAAVVPSLAFTYMLRGVGILEIAMVLSVVFLAGLLLTSFALMIAPLMTGFLGQSFAMVGLIAAIVFAQFLVGGICLGGVIGAGIAATGETWMVTGLAAVMTLSFVVLFLQAAGAQIAPVTENRSTTIRYWMLLQQLLWVAIMVGLSYYYDDFEPINFGSFVLTGYWLVTGTIFLSETRELSPRVRRDLPSTFATRVFLTPLSPGPSSGFLFAIASGGSAIVGMGIFGTAVASGTVSTEPALFMLIMLGYLLSYLGTVRLVTLPMARHAALPLPAGVLALLLVMIGAAFLPSVMIVATTGELPANYTDLEIIDWAWTLTECFDSGGISTNIAFVPLLAGLVLLGINFAFMRDLYAYRKLVVPSRVIEERGV